MSWWLAGGKKKNLWSGRSVQKGKGPERAPCRHSDLGTIALLSSVLLTESWSLRILPLLCWEPIGDGERVGSSTLTLLLKWKGSREH